MSKPLRELVGAREPVFSMRLRKLEASVHGRGIDNDLVSEIAVRANEKIRTLGLDPFDTTDEELQAALRQKLYESEELLARTYRESAAHIVSALNEKLDLAATPVVKAATIRKILTKLPPKKVMHLLGYRSIASMIKRGDIDQVLIGALLHESVTWHRAFAKELARLTTSDVTYDRPKLVLVDERLTSVKHQGPILVTALGLVGVRLGDSHVRFMNLAVDASEGLYQLGVASAYLKIRRFDGKFTAEIAKLTYAPKTRALQVAGITLSWQSVYLALSRTPGLDYVDCLVESRDLVYRYPSEILIHLHRRLDFWLRTDYVAKTTGGRPVSFNISDIAKSATAHVPYLSSGYAVMSRMVIYELMSRYLAHEVHAEKLQNLIKIGEA